MSVGRLVTFNSIIQKEIQARGCALYMISWVSTLDSYVELLGFYQVGYVDRTIGEIKVRAFCKLTFQPTHYIKFPAPININIATNDKHYAILKITENNELRMMSCYSIGRLITVIEKKEIIGNTIFNDDRHNAIILARLRKERDTLEAFADWH